MIVDTHYHFDHTGANRYVKNRYDIPIAIGRKDAPFLEDAYKSALEFMIKSESSPKADILLSEDDTIVVGNTVFEIIETPGHTEGSICLYDKQNAVLFSGDTLFYESVGRWDLPGGNKLELFSSLDRLLSLPEDTVVYPGHGSQTTIGHELKYNPYKKGVL
jgi:glyoxylase-like metal-dependent hydrolase (beta-lactamase superfamily II)